MAKQNKNVLIAIVLIAIVLGGILLLQKPQVSEKEAAVVNEGVSVKPVIVDKNGVVLEELSIVGTGGSPFKPLTIIAKEAGTGFKTVDNVATFLAIQTQLDNSAGDSVVTVNSLSATNPCASGNPKFGQPECDGINNILGSGGTGNGSLNSLWSAQLPLTLNPGEVSPIIQSDPIDISQIENVGGLIEFKIDITDAEYLDEFGNPQPLIGKGGSVVLKIVRETCNDGTPADTNSSDADNAVFCSSTNVGQYCRVDAFGDTVLTDKASLCGCPSGFEAVGEVCMSLNCGSSWAVDTCNPDGGVLYCKTDGTVESRCNQCGVANCPINANGDSAIGCNPTSGEPSECVYPTVTGSGFDVSVSGPTIDPIDECGDGVKGTGEECDTYDLGGQSCIGLGYSGGTLSCNNLVTPGDCTYDTSACTLAFVKFRTSDTTYPNTGAIAYSTACTSTPLDRYGRSSSASCFKKETYSGVCPTKTGFTLLLGISDGIPGRFTYFMGADDTGKMCLYKEDSTGYLFLVGHSTANSNHPCGTISPQDDGWGGKVYDIADSDAGAVEATSDSVDPTREVAC